MTIIITLKFENYARMHAFRPIITIIIINISVVIVVTMFALVVIIIIFMVIIATIYCSYSF